MAELVPLYDLHVHSTRSDGLRSLMELAQMAKLTGLAGFAITDHDILPDTDRLVHLQHQWGIEIIAGVEISTRWQGRPLHLLAYGFDVAPGPLADLCQGLLDRRRDRLDRLVDWVRTKLPLFDDGELIRLRNQVSPGRKHMARELIRQGFVSSTRVAFDRYLSDVGDIAPASEVPLEEAIEAVHQSGGVSILAHPPTGMTVDQWRALSMVGLDGLETCFGRVASSHRRFLEERCIEYGWVATAGSDYHGDGGRNQLGLHRVDRERLTELLARRPTLIV